MKRHFFVLLTLIMGFSAFAWADSMPTPQSTTADVFWGKLNAIYADEQRVVISDTSYDFDSRSQFFDQNGSPILLSSETNTPSDLPVTFHVIVLSDGYRLIDLRMISATEYDSLESHSSQRF
jgi:hypothetical protein